MPLTGLCPDDLLLVYDYHCSCIPSSFLNEAATICVEIYTDVVREMSIRSVHPVWMMSNISRQTWTGSIGSSCNSRVVVLMSRALSKVSLSVSRGRV